VNGFGGYGIILEMQGGDRLEGNYVGTVVTGTSARANGWAGVLSTSNSNTIGGTTAGSRNIISGNRVGVVIGTLYQLTSGNLVEGNYIGTHVTGAHALANGEGVRMFDPYSGPSNVIGGTTPGVGNLISGNT